MPLRCARGEVARAPRRPAEGPPPFGGCADDGAEAGRGQEKCPGRLRTLGGSNAPAPTPARAATGEIAARSPLAIDRGHLKSHDAAHTGMGTLMGGGIP